MNDSPEPLAWEIECEEVKTMLAAGDDFVLLDCREQDEYDRVSIERAQLIPMSQMMQRLEEFEAFRGKHVVVYCHLGGRSMQVAQWLRQQGFAKSQSMAGGIDHWAVVVDPQLPRY